MLPVAVDAMGGDHAPDIIVAGARTAAAAGTPVALVGPEDLGERVDLGGLPLIPASEVIEMHDDPAQGVRRKKDSTLVRAAEAVRDGTAERDDLRRQHRRHDGRRVAAHGSHQRREPSGDRHPDPGSRRRPDGAARRRCELRGPARVVGAVRSDGHGLRPASFRHRNPRVGLLSIGEEPGKGDTLRKEAYQLLVAAPGIEFVGNVEGRDIMTDDVDVVVTDGFTGNVVLKTLEGGLRAIVGALLAAFASEEQYKVHAEALLPALMPLYATLDPETYGGAILLGVDGVCIIAHGSSSERAIVNGIQLGREMVEAAIVDEIHTAVAGGS